jgi:hypothetical protein
MSRSFCNWKEKLIFLFHMTGLKESHNMGMFSNFFAISDISSKR